METISIPLKDGTEYEPSEEKINEWQNTYPSLDVRALLRDIRQWNVDNPKKQKTRTGIDRHINSWLLRETQTERRSGGLSAGWDSF